MGYLKHEGVLTHSKATLVTATQVSLISLAFDKNIQFLFSASVFAKIGSRDSSFDIGAECPRNHGRSPGRDKGFISPPKRPNQLCDPTSSLLNENR